LKAIGKKEQEVGWYAKITVSALLQHFEKAKAKPALDAYKALKNGVQDQHQAAAVRAQQQQIQSRFAADLQHFRRD